VLVLVAVATPPALRSDCIDQPAAATWALGQSNLSRVIPSTAPHALQVRHPPHRRAPHSIYLAASNQPALTMCFPAIFCRCGICRIGGRDNYFHCTTCGSCYSMALQARLHIC